MSDQDSLFDRLDELHSSPDSGSSYKVTLKTTKRKKAVEPQKQPKRPRLKAAEKVAENIRRGPVPSRGKTTATALNQDISANDLYEAVRSGKSAMVAVVDEWLDSYKRSQEAGLLVLINFIVLSCGCKGVVSQEMFENMENAEIISKLTKEFNEDSVVYPLCAPGPRLKRFKSGLCEFVQVLVRSCRNSFIYDEFLFPSLLTLLTGLSDSQVRAFRHTSTLLAMKLMTGLVDVAMVQCVQLQTTQRQFEMERNKRAEDKASDRLEELQNSIGELQENREELSSMMNAVFRGVFVHRYRDRLPDIRATCIEELGIWIKTDPEDFLNDRCLKYLGWTLHDKQSPVRLQCVRALQGLYQEKEFIGRLELFTSRFKERMLSMVLDKDPDVAVEVVNLLLLIQQRTEEGLKEEECSHIYPLVYVSHRGLTTAAGGFLYNKLKNMIAIKNRQNKKDNNTAFLRILMAFYIQGEFHDHGAYLVDSLWSVAGSELKDWDTMTTLLLQGDMLVCKEEAALIELMMCAMRRASQATPPVGRTQGKKFLSMKDRKIQEQDRRRITSHFIPLLPQLLAKYSADAGNVTCLLSAPLYFELQMYTSTKVMEKDLGLLLLQVCAIVEKHTDVAVLEACSRVISSLCSDCYTFSSRAHLAFSQLMDRLTECFSTYFNDILQGSADEDDVYSAATALKRIATLSCAKDPTHWKLFDSCHELLKNQLESRDLDKELMVAALKCAGMHLMWSKVNMVNSKPPEAEMRGLKKKVRSFCKVSQACLSLDQNEIRDQAFELLCDLLLLFSVSSVRSEPDLQMLTHPPSDSLRNEMASYLMDYIFTEAEDVELNAEDEEAKKITFLQKKRNQLAGYCKLVIYGVLDLHSATDVFKHYNSKYFKDFGDIIKETLSKSRLINPIQSAKTICLSLQQLFSEMLTEDHSRKDLIEIRDLAKRLAMSFGIDLRRVRKPLLALHMDGICFAFRTPEDGEEKYPNLDFLEILSEFTLKIFPLDCPQLVEFLRSQCPSTALSWPSVRMYHRSLEARTLTRRRDQEVEDAAGTPQEETPVAKRKRIAAQDLVSSLTRELGLNSSSIHSTLPTPALTSTALRQKTKKPTTGPPSEAGSAVTATEVESEEEFSSSVQLRKVKSIKQQHSASTAKHYDLNSHLDLLSLMEEEEQEHSGGEDEIEDYESDFDQDSGFALPSTRHTPVSVLDELFD
ncbi:cohesin subunit SA-1 [Gouania willdenowi]|uniref:Cohesin subunit SA n=1 Tax=Gouania willdenowi TaxID=441366 RepID=A0A8C5HDV9_GOUWI|nr:cohesin subunit SA-3 [Gouania willdenowi]XP_028315453.1 cohesin subunit SA-3 [Gouania willdenowi]XP_028315454.1 cohesin subunit SA-3 [Gouania willdenowi]XP_028315455.1 cohesin subunit SA-3 [Gouania willdenowi]